MTFKQFITEYYTLNDHYADNWKEGIDNSYLFEVVCRVAGDSGIRITDLDTCNWDAIIDNDYMNWQRNR